MSACSNCERCTWNKGPDCGKAEHPHCASCKHCQYRHVAVPKGEPAPLTQERVRSVLQFASGFFDIYLPCIPPGMLGNWPDGRLPSPADDADIDACVESYIEARDDGAFEEI